MAVEESVGVPRHRARQSDRFCGAVCLQLVETPLPAPLPPLRLPLFSHHSVVRLFGKFINSWHLAVLQNPLKLVMTDSVRR